MPLPVTTHSMTGWAFLTGAINEIKPDASFMTKLLFPNERTVPTEVIELSYLDGDRKLAPFVEVNGEAVSVAGRTTRFANVTAPNIRIKKPMDAYQFLIRRQPGTSIFVGESDVMAGYRQAIADDSTILRSLIDNRLEEFCSTMAANATYTYSVQDGANFTITFPRDSTLTATLTGDNRWAHTTMTEGSTSNPAYDFEAASFALSKFGQAPTMAIFGRRASLAFQRHSKVKDDLSNSRNILVGNLDRTAQFNEMGAKRLGTFNGIECWEYSRTYLNSSDVETYFLDQDTVLFISPTAQRENLLYFGAIPDHEAIENGLLQTRIFSKSWVTKDPSTRIQLAHTRPLPCLRRVNTVYKLVASAA